MMSPELKNRIESAKSIAVLTGAGVSAESGIATFRDPDGLWSKFKPQELANIEAFLNNPSLVQAWYAERRRVAVEAEPNPAHIALAQLETLVRTTVITQNVDNLHHRAGSQNVVELHGNILRNYCIDCGQSFDFGTSSVTDTITCSHCSGLIRPDVVWFGEMLPENAIEMASEAAIDCDVFLVVGTSAEVYPAAELPLVARRNGAFTVEMNTTASALSDHVDEIIRGPVGETLPTLVGLIRQSVTDQGRAERPHRVPRTETQDR